MRIELTGKVFNLVFEGMSKHREREGGEYGAFLYDYYSWNGVGIIKSTDGSFVETFTFWTRESRIKDNMKDALLRTSTLAYGQTLSDLKDRVRDERAIIDWLGGEIKKVLQEGERGITIPELPLAALIEMGAIYAESGQACLALA